jgi:hypothetical protein
MKTLTALAALLIAGVLNAGEPMQAPPVYLPTFVEQAPPTMPVPAAEAQADVPSTVLLAVNQCQVVNGQMVCSPQAGRAMTTWVNTSYAPVQAPAASLAASGSCTCPNCGCQFACGQQGVQAAPQAFTFAEAAPRARLFGSPRLRLFGGPGLKCCGG